MGVDTGDKACVRLPFGPTTQPNSTKPLVICTMTIQETRPNPNTGLTPNWRMALDIERCIGCHACSVACKVENTVPLGRFRTKV
jgi:ferredoxin